MTRTNVLIVEDDPVWINIYLGDLEPRYTCAVCRSREEALQALERRRFDAAIVDLALTDSHRLDREGEQVVRALHEMGEGTSTILISATANVEIASKLALMFDTRTIAKSQGVPDLINVVAQRVEAGIQGAPRPALLPLQNVFRGRLALLQWEDQLLRALGNVGIARLNQFMLNLVVPVWPLVAPKDGTWLAASQFDVAEGIYWSRALGGAVQILLGPKGSITATERDHREDDLITSNFKSGLEAAIYWMPDVERDIFQAVVPQMAPKPFEDWLAAFDPKR